MISTWYELSQRWMNLLVHHLIWMETPPFEAMLPERQHTILQADWQNRRCHSAFKTHISSHSLCLSHHYFYLVFQWGSQRLFLQPAVWMEVLAGSRSLQFLSKRYTDWEWAWKTFEGFTICEGTYFPRWWEQCLGPAGLPARPWVLHYLLTHGKEEACWNKLKLEASGSQQRNSETVLPGTGTGAPFSSIISNLSCWPVGGLSLLQSLTPTHSWGNSSVANTSSSNIGRESGSLMASCCETVTKETRKTK